MNGESPQGQKNNDDGSEVQEPSGAKQEEVCNLIAVKPFSVDRVDFLEQAKRIPERIDAIQKAAKEESRAETSMKTRVMINWMTKVTAPKLNHR